MTVISKEINSVKNKLLHYSINLTKHKEHIELSVQ